MTTPPNGATAPVARLADPPTNFLVPLAELARDNVREHEGTDEELSRLGDSLLIHQDYPILIRKHSSLDPVIKWLIADGHRRVLAATRKGMTHLVAQEVEGEQLEVALRTACHRKGLSDFELFKAVKAFSAQHPGWTRKQVAERLALHAPEVTKLLTEGIPEVEQAFAAGKITLSVRYETARLPAAEQADTLGKTREEVKAARRLRPKADSPVVRVARVRVALRSGIVVQIAGEGMSLEDVIASLTELLKEAKRANDTGLDVKTWGMVMADLQKPPKGVPCGRSPA